jgi:hypothetical protein
MHCAIGLWLRFFSRCDDLFPSVSPEIEGPEIVKVFNIYIRKICTSEPSKKNNLISDSAGSMAPSFEWLMGFISLISDLFPFEHGFHCSINLNV